MRALPVLCRSLLLSAFAPLMATAADAGQSADATFFTGAELDNQDSRRFDLGMSLRSARGTRFDLAGSRAETDSDALNVSSTSAMAKLGRDFGSVGIAAGVRHVRDEDISQTLGWIGEAFVDFASARVTATIESKSTDFDETPFEASAAELGLAGSGNVSGTAECGVDAMGYGLRVSVDRATWSLYGSAMHFEYSADDCSAAVASADSGGPEGAEMPASQMPIAITRPEVLSAFGSIVTSRLSGYSATLLPREAALLERSLMVGAAYALSSGSTLGIELYRDSEQFAPAETTTLLGYFAFALSRVVSMELSLGATDTELLDNSVFAGLRFSASFGG